MVLGWSSGLIGAILERWSYFGVPISIQVGSNFKFEFFFYEKLYIYYIYVCNSVIIDDLR